MDTGSMLLAALGIGLLIFVHELGHFLAARRCGVRVEVFSLGFGPRLCGVVLGGTDFRLSLVPFGGYVMVAGQDPSDRRYPARESLWAKSPGQRALFWSGGVLMNTLFALVVFPLVFRAGVSFLAPVAGGVERGGAAWAAGVEPGDRIVAVNGKAMYSFENLAVEVALAGQKPVRLQLRDAAGVERTVEAQPQFDREAGLFELGIAPATTDALPTLEVDAGGAAAAAGLRTGDVLVAIDGHAPRGASLPAALEALASDRGGPRRLDVQRDGASVTAEVTPRPVDPAQVPARIGIQPLPRRIAGWRRSCALAERLGLQRGDLLLAVDGRPFLAGALDGLRDGPPQLVLEVARAGARRRLAADATAAERQQLAEQLALAQEESLWVWPTAGAPAAAAGLLPGDRVESVDGAAVADWSALRRAIEAAGPRELRLGVRRLGAGAALPADAAEWPPGEPLEVRVTPQRQPLFDLGFRPLLAERREEVRAADLGTALRLGTVCSLDLIKQLYVTMKRLLTGEVGAKNLGGIIRISQVSYQAAQRGPSWFWYFLALLSVNLAFVNLLPVPVLDGGHLLFLLIEKVKGSPVSTRVLGYSQVVGLVFVLLLVLFVTYNDILRLL